MYLFMRVRLDIPFISWTFHFRDAGEVANPASQITDSVLLYAYSTTVTVVL